MARDIHELVYISENPASTLKWTCKKLAEVEGKQKTRRSLFSIEVAAGVLNRFCRCILARLRVLKVSDSIYRRVWDKESSSFYYANIKTGTSTWQKPSVYLSTEPPVLYTSEAVQSNIDKDVESMDTSTKGKKTTSTSKQLKRHPLTSRIV
jgi:hypothetical protein